MTKRDIVVIGGGPAGYVAAIRAAQLGAKVTIVEEAKFGGTCINAGCIPTKFFLHAAEIYHSIQTGNDYGINNTGTSIDLAKMQYRKKITISILVAGIEGLLKGNSIEIVKGRGVLRSPKHVEVDMGSDGKQIFDTEKIFIATGSKSIRPNIPGVENSNIVNAESLLDATEFPKSLVIIGGGGVGVEIGTILAKLGNKVTIVEMMPHIIPLQDEEIASVLTETLKADGVQIYCNSRVTGIESNKQGKRVLFSTDGATKYLEADSVSIAIGRRPNTEGIGLTECGVVTDKGKIKVNERMQTNVPGIYAIGDVTGKLMLAHVGFMQGKVAAESALGGKSVMDYRAVPQCIFTMPEIACVGLTEKEATEQGYRIQVGKFPFSANAMAAILGEVRGMVKVITERQYGQILGVHIIGPRATTLIPEATLAIQGEMTPEEIAATIHPHPTLSESIWEAAMGVKGESIHSHTRQKKAA